MHLPNPSDEIHWLLVHGKTPALNRLKENTQLLYRFTLFTLNLHFN